MRGDNVHQLPALQKPEVPPRGFGISFLALVVASLGSLFWPGRMAELSGLSWTLALVPVFLLSYYKGWEGATMAAGIVMVVFTLVEVVLSPVLGSMADWELFGIVAVVLTGVTLGAGWVTERLHGQRIGAVQLAYEDSLTELPSRRALDFFLTRQVAAARRGNTLSVVFFDLDEFKRYNDRHGHSAGDRFLHRVGEVMQRYTRAMNLVGRYGGEEFLAILPGEDAEGAEKFAHRIREKVAVLQPADGEGCTISAGVATFDQRVVDDADLLTRADQALYDAKSSGGDAVRVYQPDDPADAVGDDVTS